MASQSKQALRDLIELGKEHGYLTLEEINRSLTTASMSSEEIDGLMSTLEDLGIEVVDRRKFKMVSPAEKEAYTEEWESTPDVSSSIRMYLSEMGKVPLLNREEEVTLARNVRERERELRLLVLESPITMREIRNWENLIAQQEMTPKELMPRGRKTAFELAGMRRRMRTVAQFIARSETFIERQRAKLERRKLSLLARKKITKRIEGRTREIVNRIISLNLNQDKIKRLTNKIKNLAQKIRECDDEFERYSRRYGCGYQELKIWYRQTQIGRMSKESFRSKTGYVPSAVEAALENMENVADRLDRMKRSLPIPVDKFLELDDKIVTLENQILQDKLKLIKANLRL
ncbi:MAG: hypothetical protein HY551_06145, partial [Elusimicrobia bacterium]|nr:hypothetical protein [Elusimicrobiota bacterium]